MYNELYHHGILGQKWGVRRYQNPDGTLTEAGKKRAAKLEDEYTRITSKNLRRNNNDENKLVKTKDLKNKRVDEMTNEEIQAKIDRLRLENTLASLEPKTISKGKSFISLVGKKVVEPAAAKAGSEWLEKQLKEVMGLNKEKTKTKSEKLSDELDVLTKSRDIERAKVSIKEIKAGNKDPYFKNK